MRIVFFLLLFSVFPTLSAQKGAGVIEVTGAASMEVVPDYLDMQIIIEQHGDDAADVQEALMEKSREILAYLKGRDGITNVKTERVNLMPRQDYQSKNVTYHARQVISFRFTDLALYEKSMPGLLEMGVTGVSRSVFGTSKLAEIQTRLTQEALLNAREKASLMANTMGQSIGDAIYISDELNSSSPYPLARDLKFSSEAPSIEAGSRELSQSVRVHFQLNSN